MSTSTQTLINKHLASIVHAEAVQTKYGYWHLRVTMSDGSGHEDYVGMGKIGESNAKAQASKLMDRVKTERAKAPQQLNGQCPSCHNGTLHERTKWGNTAHAWLYECQSCGSNNTRAQLESYAGRIGLTVRPSC